MARRSHLMPVVVAVLLALPVLYVLSFGPYSMAYAGVDDPEWALAFYQPLAWAVEQSDTAQNWMAWYIDIWTPDPEPQEDIRDSCRSKTIVCLKLTHYQKFWQSMTRYLLSPGGARNS